MIHRGSHRRLVRHACAAGLAILSAVAMGCGTRGPVLVNEEEYRAAHAALRAGYELPEGFAWAEAPEQETGTMFEEGVAQAQVEDYWTACWITEWLEQRGKDTDREREALRVLRDMVPETRVMKEFSDETIRRMYADAVARAELGDPGGMEEQLRLNGIVPVRSQQLR